MGSVVVEFALDFDRAPLDSYGVTVENPSSVREAINRARRDPGLQRAFSDYRPEGLACRVITRPA